MSNSLLAFLAVSAVVIATPGPDTALTVRNVLLGGRLAGIATALGVAVGQVIWAAATSLGLVALLLASESVFNGLRLLGAAYLLYLGLQSLRSALQAGPMSRPALPPAPATRLPPAKAFWQGVINDLANPKMAVFFASVLPQFAEPGKGMFSQLVALGMFFALLTFAWLALYSYLLSLVGDRLRSSRTRRAMDGLAGTALVALGVRVATADR